jgi:hypothetical protein
MLKAMHVNAHQDLRKIHPEFSRILSAAVINRKFREMLLDDPSQAVSRGFNGESFNLSSKEKSELSSLKGLSLADFASQLAQI